MARQMKLVSQSSRTGAGHIGENDLTKLCIEPHVSFSAWRTIPSWNPFHYSSSLTVRPVDVQHEICPTKLHTHICVCVCVYLNIHIHIHTHIYIWSEREKSGSTWWPKSLAGKSWPLHEMQFGLTSTPAQQTLATNQWQYTFLHMCECGLET